MIALFAAVALLSVQEADPAPDCATAVSTLDVNACLAQEVDKAEARLRTYLDAALTHVREGSGQYADQTAAEIVDSQTAWTAYADQACGAVYSYWQEGTIRGAMALGCRLDLMQERTHHLWDHYLDYPDGAPPILPEPAPWWRREGEPEN